MTIISELKAMEAWALEVYNELGKISKVKFDKRGSSNLVNLPRIVMLLESIDSQGKKLEYGRRGLKGIEFRLNRFEKYVQSLEGMKRMPTDLNPAETLKRLKLSYNSLKKFISQGRAAVQQILGMVEPLKKIETNEGYDRKARPIFSKALKFTGPMFGSLKGAVNAYNNVDQLIYMLESHGK